MRNAFARYTLVTLTILSLSGCQSSGWSMRSLAFWEKDSSSDADAPGVTPSMPSVVAGTASTPAPGAGYTSNTTSTTAPSAAYPSGNLATNGGYPSPGQYPSTGSYGQPQSGLYGATTASPTPPNLSTNPYANPTGPQYGSPGGYSATGTAAPYTNPVRPANNYQSPYATGTPNSYDSSPSPYGGSTDPYGSATRTASNPYNTSNP